MTVNLKGLQVEIFSPVKDRTYYAFVQTPIDFCEQPKHIRGPHKNVYVGFSGVLEYIGFYKVKNFIGDGTMDQ
jgi:hypothetical protein